MRTGKWILLGTLLFGFIAGALLSRYVTLNNSTAQNGTAESADLDAMKAILNENPANLSSFMLTSKVIAPSVVSINATVSAGRTIILNPFHGLEEEELENTQAGTGVILSPDGYILTNNHVIQGSKEVTVTLFDKRDFAGKLIGTDPETDLAVVKIDAHNLIPAEIGDSDNLQTGEWVIAAGNPFTLNNTITAGIISATGRGGVGLAAYEGYIQTDAAINPGNSGGPLVNLKGKVIGINTAIMSRTGSNQGIGFAIPINRAKFVLDGLKDKGKVLRGYLGVQTLNFNRSLVDYINKQYQMNFKNTQDLLDFLKMKEIRGVFVAQVLKKAPAENAKLVEGDILIEYNGKKVNSSYELQDYVAMTLPDAQASMKVIRDGKILELNTIIGTRPSK